MQKPTAEYLNSCARTDVPIPRKLVILDLNGTLLFRSPPQQRPRGLSQQPGSSRNVYPRPYMPSFRAYLFHMETRAWLDTMIWSSAQPHNVATMVQTCFGADKDKLFQIWSRDCMKLDKDSYNKKVQTIKDLDQVWQYFNSTPYRHSVYSTVLFDDSLKKAVYQPFNHIAVKEYDGDMCRKDLSLPFKYDSSLLALVGVLEDLRGQGNVAKWIKDGHIIPRDVPATTVSTWFQSETCLQYWTRKGLNTLDRLGIPIKVGVE